jgi:lipoprotein NlpI
MLAHPSLRSAFLACLISCAALAVAVRADDNAALEQRFKEANAKLDAGESQPALEIYNEILEAEPEAGNVWVMRAIAKWKLKDPSGARADLAQAIKLHPDNLDAYRVRGQVRYEAKDFANSRKDFTEAIELNETNIKALEASGDAAERATAREMRKEGGELHGMRAEVEKQLGETAAAIQDLDQAIDLKPDYPAAFFLRAQLHETEGDADAATADYSRVIELNPKHAQAWNNRAWIRFHALQWDQAIGDGRKVLELAPKTPEALRVIGYAEFAKGDYAGAAKTLAAAAEADDAAGAAYPLLVRHFALLRSGGADDRLATAWGAWQDEPWLQALAKFVMGRISEDELEAVAQAGGDDAELAGRSCEMHFYVGLARKQAGDKSTARLRFQSALGTQQKTYVEDALAAAELKR